MKIAAIVAGVVLSFTLSSMAQVGPSVKLTVSPKNQSSILSFQADSNTVYIIQDSGDLNTWTTIQTFQPLTTGLWGLILPYDATLHQFFYRVAKEWVTISLDGLSPGTSSVIVNNTTQGQYLDLPVMVFDIHAQGDTLHLHSLSVNVSNIGGGTVSAAYLYQGVTPIASAQIINGTATFSPVSDGQTGATIPANATVPFTVKVDVSGLTAGVSPAVITASTSAATVYDSTDAAVVTTGTAVGNTITVFGEGAGFAVSGQPTISKVDITAPGATNSTFKYIATFNVNVTAVGEDVTMGATNSLYPAFWTSSSYLGILTNGHLGSSAGIQSTVTVSYEIPSNVLVLSGARNFRIAQNQSATIPVTYTWQVTGNTSTTYAAMLEQINWSTTDGTPYTAVLPQSAAWTTDAL